MDRNKFVKFFAIIFTFFIIQLAVLPSVYAKTSSYANETTTDDTGSSETNSWIADILLSALGKSIFGIGWCIEKLGSLVVNLLTEVKMFPWADRVIFNSVPLLDVNFINPAPHSLFLTIENNAETYTKVGNAVRSVYFSGMSIGLGFFGIIVAVMAIKLALSSIASEKAKYKEAIVNWFTALVLLFSLHYILSFVFYLNEQLVDVAGSIVNTQIKASPDAKTVSDLGQYFKAEATKDWSTDTFIACVVYSVFVVQSLMFFYAYVKRLFFVVILAVISPFVVIYDFLKKAIS